MTTKRPGKPVAAAMKERPAGSLKEAVLLLVDALGGHVRAGTLWGIGKGHVQRMTDPDGDTANVYPGINKVLIAEAVLGDPIVTRFLASEAGYSLMKIEAVKSNSLTALAVMLAGEFGDVLRAVADGTADDGMLDRREAGRVVAEVDQVLAVLAGIRATATKIRDGRA